MAKLLSREEYRNAKRISVYLSMEGKEVQTEQIVRDALETGKKVFVPYTYRTQDVNKLVNQEHEEKQESRTTADEKQHKPTSVMDMLALRDWEDYEGFVKDKWGIPTPAKEGVGERENCYGLNGLSNGEMSVAEERAAEAGLDLIVMPGVAFDIAGGRLGHGKGYYDQFLARYHEAMRGKMPFLGALCHNFCVFFRICKRSKLILQMTKVGIALNEQILPHSDLVPLSQNDWPLDSLIAGDGSSIAFTTSPKSSSRMDDAG